MTSPANDHHDHVNLKSTLCKGSGTTTLNSETITENGGSDESALTWCLENTMVSSQGRRPKQEASHVWEHDCHSQQTKLSSLIFPKLHPAALKLCHLSTKYSHLCINYRQSILIPLGVSRQVVPMHRGNPRPAEFTSWHCKLCHITRQIIGLLLDPAKWPNMYFIFLPPLFFWRCWLPHFLMCVVCVNVLLVYRNAAAWFSVSGGQTAWTCRGGKATFKSFLSSWHIDN